MKNSCFFFKLFLSLLGNINPCETKANSLVLVFFRRLSMNLSSIWNNVPGHTQLPAAVQHIGQGTTIQQPNSVVAAYPVQRFQVSHHVVWFQNSRKFEKTFQHINFEFCFIFTVTGRGLADAEFASLMVATWSFDNIKIVMNNSGVYIITVTRIQNCKLEMYNFFLKKPQKESGFC